MTRQQKIYGVLLLAAAGAWCIDRFILNGGITAPPVADATQLLAIPPAAGKTSTSPAAKTTESLASRFANYSHHSNLQEEALDAFAPPAAWIAEPIKVAVLPATAPAVVFDGEKFRRDHKLTGFIRSGDHNRVLINGRFLEIGQELDGLTLVSTTSESATFRSPEAEVILRMNNFMSADDRKTTAK